MADFGIRLVVEAAIFVPLFFGTFVVLWNLRAYGILTTLLGFVFFLVLVGIGYGVAPKLMQWHREKGVPPIEQAMMLGCCMPMVYMFMYHLKSKD